MDLNNLVYLVTGGLGALIATITGVSLLTGIFNRFLRKL